MPSPTATDGPITSRIPKQQRGRERVSRLTAAAATLFVERGVDATTMTEIAARAGASIGSLYLFFPTKPALARAMLADLADALSGQLDELAPRCAGIPAAAIADAVFGTFADFLRAHPVYAILAEQPGDETWRLSVRARRRTRIAALLDLADPKLPPGQAERLAVLLPALMRTAATLEPNQPTLRDDALAELRAMLRHHLTAEDGPSPTHRSRIRDNAPVP